MLLFFARLLLITTSACCFPLVGHLLEILNTTITINGCIRYFLRTWSVSYRFIEDTPIIIILSANRITINWIQYFTNLTVDTNFTSIFNYTVAKELLTAIIKRLRDSHRFLGKYSRNSFEGFRHSNTRNASFRLALIISSGQRIICIDSSIRYSRRTRLFAVTLYRRRDVVCGSISVFHEFNLTTTLYCDSDDAWSKIDFSRNATNIILPREILHISKPYFAKWRKQWKIIFIVEIHSTVINNFLPPVEH